MRQHVAIELAPDVAGRIVVADPDFQVLASADGAADPFGADPDDLREVSRFHRELGALEVVLLDLAVPTLDQLPAVEELRGCCSEVLAEAVAFAVLERTALRHQAIGPRLRSARELVRPA